MTLHHPKRTALSAQPPFTPASVVPPRFKAIAFRGEGKDLEAHIVDCVLTADAESALAAKQRELDAALERVGEFETTVAELVDLQDEWNAAMVKIIGRPVDWSDRYLNKARNLLAKKGAAE